MINVIISFEVNSSSIEEVKMLIATFIQHIKKNEPETYTYRSFQEIDNPTKFNHVMSFANEEAQQKHRNSSYCKEFVSGLYPQCVTEPHSIAYTEV